MTVRFHKHFQKAFQKRGKKQQCIIRDRLALFLRDPFDARLRNHPLKGTFRGYRSIDITHDLRALYKQTPDEAIFVHLGSHSELYE